MIYRVFARSTAEVLPSMIAEHLHTAGLPVEPHFHGDELGWTRGQLVLPGGGTPVQLDRYLAKEDDLRDDLNTFAAVLETMTYSPNHRQLMEHVIQTQQLFACRKPLDHADESMLEKLCLTLAQFLAASTDGVYQIDTQGWFAANGELLLQEY